MAGSSLPEDNQPNDEVGEAVDDMATLGALLGETYRGELDRETTWRSRLD